MRSNSRFTALKRTETRSLFSAGSAIAVGYYAGTSEPLRLPSGARSAHIKKLVAYRRVTDNVSGQGLNPDIVLPLHLRRSSQSVQLIGGAWSNDIRIPLTENQIEVSIPVRDGEDIEVWVANDHSAVINFSFNVIFEIEYEL